MKVLTFSRFYPRKHPKVGEATFFVEKILNNFFDNGTGWANDNVSLAVRKYTDVMGAIHNPNHYAKKVHTIRAGNRWKAGEWFSPRVWTGQPYCSKQIEFAPPIMIEKIFDIEMYGMTTLINDKPINSLTLDEVAENDGLKINDFKAWFVKLPFKGQIICWSNKIQY